jgi:phosphatidylserine/phosphatidylglycerophosphate/cardiolipin synthase-like enzyme
VGSSNYGYRSQNRDLEAQALIVTTDPALRDRVRAYAYATLVLEESGGVHLHSQAKCLAA